MPCNYSNNKDKLNNASPETVQQFDKLRTEYMDKLNTLRDEYEPKFNAILNEEATDESKRSSN